MFLNGGITNIYITSKTNLTMEINMTKMSSKGQVVIPRELRKDIKEGDKLVVIRNADQMKLPTEAEPRGIR